MKKLVSQNQTNPEVDDNIWDLIRQILSHPSTEEKDSQHDIHSKIAFDIMLAYEDVLPTTEGTEDELERQKFKEKVRTCVQHVIRAFPPGEIQGLSAEPRTHAKTVILAIQKRMENMGGVDQILQRPDDRQRWSKIVTVAGGGDVTLRSFSDYRTSTWDSQSSSL